MNFEREKESVLNKVYYKKKEGRPNNINTRIMFNEKETAITWLNARKKRMRFKKKKEARIVNVNTRISFNEIEKEMKRLIACTMKKFWKRKRKKEIRIWNEDVRNMEKASWIGNTNPRVMFNAHYY